MNKMGEDIKDPREIGTQGLKGVNVQQNQPSEEFNFGKYFKENPVTPESWAAADKKARDNTFFIETTGSSDYGKSRFDKRIVNPSDLEDINEFRAQEQSGIEKVGAGVLKAGVLTATTFADSFGGTLIGALNAAGTAIGGGSAGEVFNAFIENPFSKAMQQINEWSEEALPNYYTNAENENYQNGQWYKNIFSANFIGDHFIKNLGFMAGAALSGQVSAGMMSKALQLNKYRNIMNGATVMSSTGEKLTDASKIYKAYKAGDAMMDEAQMLETIAKNAKRLTDAEQAIKFTGAVTGAIGEGRIEAITNSQEYFDKYKAQYDQAREQFLSTLDDQLFSEHPEWFSLAPKFNSEGQLVGADRVLTHPAGEAEKQRRVEAMQAEYDQNMEQLAKEQANYANNVFALNLAILTPSNIFQFGRYLTGGYTGQKSALNLVSRVAGKYEAAPAGEIALSIGKAVASPAAEGTEEMLQQSAATAMDIYESNKSKSFLGKQFDTRATEDTISYFEALAKGIGNTYGDKAQWEQFAIGAVTALVGFPGISKVTTREGKTKTKVSLGGEFWDNIKDVKEHKNQAREIAESLNKLSEDPKVKNYFFSLVRDNAITNIQNEALQKNDRRTFKNAESDKFINWALTYMNAGRTEDLKNDIISATTYTDEQLQQIMEDPNYISKETGKSIFEGKTVEQFKQELKKEQEQALKKLETFNKVAQNVDVLYGSALSAEGKNEMIYLMSTIDDRENRIKGIIQEAQNSLQPVAENIKTRTGVDISTTFKNISDFQVYFGEDGDYSLLLSEAEKIANGDQHALKRMNKKIENRKKKLQSKYGKIGRETQLTNDSKKIDRLRKDIATIKGEIDAIKKEVADKHNSIPIVEKNAIQKSLEDIIPLLAERATLLNTIDALSTDPSTVERDAYENGVKVLNYFADKRITDSYNKIAKDPTLANLRAEISNLEGANEDSSTRLFGMLMSKLTNGTDKTVGLVKTYNEINNFKNVVAESLEQVDASDVVVKALYDAIDNANSSQEALDSFNRVLERLQKFPQYQGVAEAVVKAYNNTVEAKKKLAAKKAEEKKGGSLFSKAASTSQDNEDAAMQYDEYANEDLKEAYEDLQKDHKDFKLSFEPKDWDNLTDAEADQIRDELNEELYGTEEFKAKKLAAQKAAQTPKAEKEGDSQTGESDEITYEELPPATAAESSEKPTGEAPTLASVEVKGSPKDTEGNSESTPSEETEDAWHIGRRIPFYEISSLKDVKTRLAKLFKGTTRDQKAILKELDKVGAREFIESGKLSKMQAEAAKDGKKVKIHFIKIPGVYEGNDGNLHGKFNAKKHISNAIARDVVFYAVETPEGQTTAFDKNGNARKFQIIGGDVVNQCDKDFQKLHEDIIKETFGELVDGKYEGGIESQSGNQYVYSVATPTSELEWIYSGRIVKSDSDHETVEQRPLSEVMGNAEFDIAVQTQTEEFIIGKELKGDVVPLNLNYIKARQRSNERYGTAWLRVREADGRIYYKSVRVRMFDKNYDNMNSPYGKKITKYVSDFVDAINNKDMKKVRDALTNLRQYVYFPVSGITYSEKANKIFIRRFTDTGSGNASQARTVDLSTMTPSEAKNAVIDTMKKVGLRFALGYTTRDEIIKSDIFSTDLARLTNVNQSILISKVVKDSSEGIDSYRTVPSTTGEALRGMTVIHHGESGYKASRGRNYATLKFGDRDAEAVQYQKDGDGRYYKTDEDGNLVEFNPTNDLRALIDLHIAIINREVSPTPFYLHKKTNRLYSAVTEDGNTVYMEHDGYVPTDEEVKDIHHKIAESNKEKKTKAEKQLKEGDDKPKSRVPKPAAPASKTLEVKKPQPGAKKPLNLMGGLQKPVTPVTGLGGKITGKITLNFASKGPAVLADLLSAADLSKEQFITALDSLDSKVQNEILKLLDTRQSKNLDKVVKILKENLKCWK